MELFAAIHFAKSLKTPVNAGISERYVKTKPMAYFFFYTSQERKLKTMEAKAAHIENALNVGDNEKMGSLITGGYIFGSGLMNIKQRPVISIAKAILGGYLIYRGVSGKCAVKDYAEKLMAQ